MKNGGGHFAPELGGHFELESGGHFKLELGGQYHWNLHYCRYHKEFGTTIVYKDSEISTIVDSQLRTDLSPSIKTLKFLLL